MTLTRDHAESYKERAAIDPEFRKGMLEESVALFLAGEMDVAKIMLRHYINSAIGFEGLSALTGISVESLSQMLSADGNPAMSDFSNILGKLQKAEGVAAELSLNPVAA